LQRYNPDTSEKATKEYIIDPIGLEHYITQFSLCQFRLAGATLVQPHVSIPLLLNNKDLDNKMDAIVSSW